METKFVVCTGLVALSGLISLPASAAPHWTHADQADWGAIDDLSQSQAPLMYPYAECGIGSHQSPVDLSGEANSEKLNMLEIQYVKDTPDFFNSGHAVQVITSASYKGVLKIGNDIYPLTQFHFHAPSEHVIGFKTFPAELHFVHVRPDGRIAVLGVLLKEGAANPAIQTILDNVPATTTPPEPAHNTNSGVALNPKRLLPEHKSHFYTYAGSLTTPPCSEGVSWYVLAEPVEASTAQIAQLEGFYKDNNRWPQNLNGRTVTGTAKRR
jgi:carbonic anhydrase